MKYAWIDTQRTEYGLDEMCRVLDVSESGYRAWKRGGKLGRKRLTDSQMLTLIPMLPEHGAQTSTPASGVPATESGRRGPGTLVSTIDPLPEK